MPPEQPGPTRQELRQATMPYIGCEVAAIERSDSEADLESGVIREHVAACDDCQRRETGAAGLN